jgi:hypothetical protein
MRNKHTAASTDVARVRVWVVHVRGGRAWPGPACDWLPPEVAASTSAAATVRHDTHAEVRRAAAGWSTLPSA